MTNQTAFLAELSSGANKLNIILDEGQLNKLLAFMELLRKWNKAYNLTAIDTPHKIMTHHLLDSLSIVPYIEGPLVIDVGSGAGIPGIPCAIALPHFQFYLLDSNGKKTRFMTQVLGELKITNATAIQSRAEQYSPSVCFNTITARAFSSLENVINSTKHLGCKEGQLLVMKGVYPKAELQKISNHAKVLKLSVPYLHEERHLVCLKGLLNE